MEACHSPEQFNVTSYAATSVAIVILEAFAGMWINAFIVSVICVAWVKKKTLNSNEKILLVLGSSRFWFLCFAWLYYFLSKMYRQYQYVHPIFQLLALVHRFFNCSEVSVSTCLCVFYCIKIANFRNSFFIYLKVKIDRMVPWLLLGSVLFSLVIGILLFEIIEKPQCNNSTALENFWKVKIKIDAHFLPIYFITGFGYAASFVAVILSVLLLLFSLWRHKRNMQTNSMKDLSMDAHIRAMKSILSFFVMYSINIISLIVTIIYSAEGKSVMMFLFYVFQYAFPGVHSLILIFSNPKLENTLLRILPCVKCKVGMR
ncbi:PREDICTED: taste receptor type 2 member 41-like [Lepidothrix coronata]|uniref:Taste receptor type 2 n=1 Tax=Lepidothrix coronata TaxID=321398 RepID=A0A6J0H365_9PASS|nr:PREDICTED: taste receptor type 2 member 41-like [Lepidothrix coronata]